MVFYFTARAIATAEEENLNYRTAALGEQDDGGGAQLIFQSGLKEPDKSDIDTGMDSHCLVTANQGTAYGCIKEALLKDTVLCLVLTEESLEELGLRESIIEVTFEAKKEDISDFTEMLGKILRYGRPSSYPRMEGFGSAVC